MSTIYHEPIVVGESNSPATVNSRLGTLDAAIVATTSELDERIDNIIAQSGTSDTEVVDARTAIPYAAGTPPTTLSETLEYLAGEVANVMAYGAVGNGVANDTAAIQAAISNNQRVYFPPGSYRCDNVTVPANRTLIGTRQTTLINTQSSGFVFILQGSFITLQAFNFSVAGGSYTIFFDLATANLDNIHIEHCTFRSAQVALYARAVNVAARTLSNVSIQDCIFEDLAIRAIDLLTSIPVPQGTGHPYTLNNFRIERCTFTDVAPESSASGNFDGIIYIGGLTSVSDFYLVDNVATRVAPLFFVTSQSTNPRRDFVIRGNTCRQQGTTSVVHMCYQFANIDNLVFVENSCYYVEFEHALFTNCRNFKIANCHFEDANVGISINDLARGERSYGEINNCSFVNIQCPTSDNNGHKAIYVVSDGAEISVSNCFFRRGTGSKAQIGIDTNYSNITAGHNGQWARAFDSANYTWTLDAGSRYYVRSTGLTNGFVGFPISVYENDTQLTPGTLATLTAGQWAYGDNNALGFDTLYVRLSDSTAPTNLEVSASYGRYGVNITNCQFEHMSVGINANSGGSANYPGHARVLNCSFIWCGSGCTFSFPRGNVVTGCMFRDCVIDVRTVFDTPSLRCTQNYHHNTNSRSSATSGAYAMTVSTGFCIWEISSCTFRNVKNLQVVAGGGFTPRKRFVIWRDNDVDSASINPPAIDSSIWAISNADRVLAQSNAAPAAGVDWQIGDTIWNSDPAVGETLGWAMTGTSAPTNARAMVAQVHYTSGAGAPSANALFIGQEHLDTTNNKWYKAKAVGTGAADWVALN